MEPPPGCPNMLHLHTTHLSLLTTHSSFCAHTPLPFYTLAMVTHDTLVRCLAAH